MKNQLLKSKLSQLGFSDLKALDELFKTHYDSLMDKDLDLESVDAIKFEKEESLKALNETINDKINLLLV